MLRHTTVFAVAVIAVTCAATAHASVYESEPTDDIWVTFMAANPCGDHLLRVWHETDQPYPSPNYPANPADFYCAYAYLKWDLSSVPPGRYDILSATLTLRHQPATWSLQDGLDNPIEARSLAPDFSEYTWDYWNTANPAPGGVYGESDLSNYSQSAYFDITCDLFGGSSKGREESDFAAAFIHAVNARESVAIACMTTKSADMSGGQPYKFASKENAQAGPTLRVEYALKSLGIAEAKISALPPGELVRLEGKVVSTTLESSADTMYICEPDRSVGIGVKLNGQGSGLAPGDIVTVEGTTVLWDDSEFGIEATSITKTGSCDPPGPMGMSNASTGGGAFGNQSAIAGASGLNNVGMLVRTTGVVTGSHSWFALPSRASAQVFWIDDGSGVSDGLTDGSGAPAKGVAVAATAGMSFPPAGFMAVTGVLRCISGPNGPARVIFATEVDSL